MQTINLNSRKGNTIPKLSNKDKSLVDNISMSNHGTSSTKFDDEGIDNYMKDILDDSIIIKDVITILVGSFLIIAFTIFLSYYINLN